MKVRIAFALSALFLLLSTSAGATPLAVPALSAPVEDLAGVLVANDAQALDSDIRDLLAQTGMQAQVLIIPSLEGETIEEYSIRVAEKWKLGNRKTDEGLLLVVAVREHRIRVEVGRGLEGSVTDLESSRMIREILAPAFKQGQYYAGMKSFLDRVRALTKGEANAQEAAPEAERDARSRTLPPGAAGLLFLALLAALVLDWVLRSRPVLRGGAYAGVSALLCVLAYLHPALGIPILLILFFPVFAFFIGFIGLLNLFQLFMVTGRGGGGFGGGGGGSWGGGGGSFNGGGASGSW